MLVSPFSLAIAGWEVSPNPFLFQSILKLLSTKINLRTTQHPSN